MFVLKAGRSLSWPDSYHTFQHGIFLLASLEQQQPCVYPGWKTGGTQSVWLPGVRCCPSWSPELLKVIMFEHSPALLNRLTLKVDLSIGLRELFREGLPYILFTRLDFNAFPVASCISVAF